MIGEITNHLWQSILFLFAAGLLGIAFRKNRAGVRYALWLSASCTFLVPFSFFMVLGSLLARARSSPYCFTASNTLLASDEDLCRETSVFGLGSARRQ